MTHFVTEYEDLLHEARNKANGNQEILSKITQHYDLSCVQESSMTASYVAVKRRALEKFMRKEFDGC